MYVERIDWAEQRNGVAVARHPGIDGAVDALTPLLAPEHRFLRAAWFGAADDGDAATLIAWRGDDTPLAAIPTIGFGPALVGARTVPGSYWPFRALPIAADASAEELADFLAHPVTLGALGQVWRLGPTYAEDPATQIFSRAAAMAGWTVLSRPLGQTFIFDPATGWPRASTRRRLANYARQLQQQGAVTIESVRGARWSAALLDDLSAIEQASWVGRATDGTGAKFLSETRRADWRRVLGDPALAQMLMATVLRVDGRPIAFSFDLLTAPVQYSIASSYDEAFAAYRPGKLVTAHLVGQAAALGIDRIDFGSGDSGYKREMGAEAGSRIVDLLLVRNRAASSLLQLRWGPECAIAAEAYRTASLLRHAARARKGRSRIDMLMAMGAIAAAAISFGE